jgi:hypothetical protein
MTEEQQKDLIINLQVRVRGAEIILDSLLPRPLGQTKDLFDSIKTQATSQIQQAVEEFNQQEAAAAALAAEQPAELAEGGEAPSGEQQEQGPSEPGPTLQ